MLPEKRVLETDKANDYSEQRTITQKKENTIGGSLFLVMTQDKIYITLEL